MTLRCTRKLLKRLHAPAGFSPTPPTTVLGDWYANLYHARPQQLVVCLNERTLLAVVIQARDAKSFIPRFREAALDLLARIGVPGDAIAAERRSMADIAFGPTANRRVLGCLNQAAFALSVDFEWAPDKYLGDHEIFLSQLIYSVTQYRRPCELARELFQAVRPSSQPAMALVH